ncbi:transcriptional regulator [Bacillus cereus]|uniref:helix-turn-helix domain-containing protein n=1 Tax=Bacillus cereus TaxID=1396 RepID=UPI000BF30914|nr:helix-turn-helix transcriptional regulator [Bacillus cereus]PEW67204.1 transcriptional regulator [Bacillus cereus]
MIGIKSKSMFIELVYKSGYSLSDLAKKVGISQSNLSNVVNGRNGVSPKNAKAIIEALNTNFDVLFKVDLKESEVALKCQLQK